MITHIKRLVSCCCTRHDIHISNSCLHDSSHHCTPPTPLSFLIRPRNDTPSHRPPSTVKEIRSLSSQTSPIFARRCIVRLVSLVSDPVTVNQRAHFLAARTRYPIPVLRNGHDRKRRWCRAACHQGSFPAKAGRKCLATVHR